MRKSRWKRRIRLPVGSLAVLAAMVACSSQAPEADEHSFGNAVTVDTMTAPTDVANETAATAQGGGGTADSVAPDRTAVDEPTGATDPTSAQAAGQVAQRYGALLEQRKFAEARKLWGQDGAASGLSERQFAAAYEKYATIHSEVGQPTDMEGAAGSVYITVPFRLYGTLKSGGTFDLSGPLTLRRVNDVPGSSEAQRRWHIERSALKPRP
jgi:hypothetical protein